jgi:hypothetical protein
MTGTAPNLIQRLDHRQMSEERSGDMSSIDEEVKTKHFTARWNWYCFQLDRMELGVLEPAEPPL